jgi:hypothetical protein
VVGISVFATNLTTGAISSSIPKKMTAHTPPQKKNTGVDMIFFTAAVAASHSGRGCTWYRMPMYSYPIKKTAPPAKHRKTMKTTRHFMYISNFCECRSDFENPMFSQ